MDYNGDMIFLVAFFGLVVGWFIRGLFARREVEKTVDQFKSLSADVLQQNNASFLDLANATFEKYQERAKGEFDKKSESIEQAMKPIKESLGKVDGKILELEKARVGAYSSLKQQVESLLVSQKELRSETANLVKALRKPNVRGRWGEIQLKRVVEMAGMLDHCDFFEQTSVTTDEGRLRPDLVVKLPGDKQIIVDAKAPLDAYLTAIEADSDEIKQQEMKRHAQQIRTHVNLLSRKSYWEQFSSTPEFVVLFLPGETFFSAALEYDPSLIESGVEQRVILATPTTLIALLRAVSYGWRQENISRNAAEVCALGKELYKRLADVSGHWTKVGKHMTQAVQSYNKAVGSFESRVLVSARRFQELGTSQEIETLEPVESVTREIGSVQKALHNNSSDA